jgi:TPR repeat protein
VRGLRGRTRESAVSAIVAFAVCASVAAGAGEPTAPAPDPASDPPQLLGPAMLGAWVVPLLPRPRRMLGLPPAVQGLLVDGVLHNGPAARAGIRKGDVIGAVDGEPSASLCAFGASLDRKRPGAERTLLVRRMSGAVTARVTTIANGGEVAARECDRGDALGCFLSGIVVRDSSERGAESAVRFFEKSCNDGFADACSALGEAYRDGRGAPRDDAKARDAFHRACENGSSSGCTSEAFQYATGTGARRDDAWATPIFERGCDLGSASGCYNVGLMYEKGRGVAQDLGRARIGYEQGCEGGDFLACTNLGYLHEQGLGVPPDDARAAKLYSRGCEGDGCRPGDPNACLNLAIFHRRGRGGLRENKRKAAELFGTACARNQGAACGELGAMIGSGEGVPRDEQRAASLYQKACSLDYELGCANLASALAYGSGVETDRERAASIFRRLCESGDEISCRELERLGRKTGGAAW